MKGKKVISCILILSILFCAVAITVTALSSDHNIFRQAGQFFRTALNGMASNVTQNNEVVAKYNGMPITVTAVEYNKSMNILRDEESAAERDTDIEVINKIIESMILQEEAERLGLSATDAEIEGMVSSAVEAYSLPQGKEMIDPFLEGAGITFDEYIVLLREQAPRVIARQKLIDEIGKQYCKQNGLEFTKINPPAELIAAQKAFIEQLFEQNKNKIEYFINNPVLE